MMISELIREALRNLAHHKLRSLLTALGIIFGIASVMSMVSTGEGARRAILDQIGKLGVRNVIVNAKKPPPTAQVDGESENDGVLDYGLTFRDAERIAASLPMIERVLRVRDAQRWLWFGSNRLEGRVRGVEPIYFDLFGLEPIRGRKLVAEDGLHRRRVCVVRADLFERAKFTGDPLRMRLRVGAQYYRVVGVLPPADLQEQGRSALGIDDRNLEIYVPFTTAIDRYGVTDIQDGDGSFQATRVELHQLVCVAKSEELVIPAARAVRAVLEHGHDRQDYEIVVPVELLASRQRTQRVFDLVLPIIAGISLLVGGIGILNIMLASITERTREIGIRRAIGATKADITLQFLIETVTLTTIGGLLGILGGLGGVVLLERVTSWQPVITAGSIVLSISISVLTGVVFGIYPARRAAAMNPIQALRHE